MTPAQIDHFHQKLLQSRAALLRELDDNPAADASTNLREGDQADQSTAEAERESLAVNRERTRMMLAEVNQAIARIDNGTYGICEDTGAPIGLKRLEVQPTATLSIEAQAERERLAQ